VKTVADVYRKQAVFDKAQTLYHQALAIFRINFGNSHPQVAEILSCLAYRSPSPDRADRWCSLLRSLSRPVQTHFEKEGPVRAGQAALSRCSEDSGRGVRRGS
jgi:hypothetical protein